MEQEQSISLTDDKVRHLEHVLKRYKYCNKSFVDVYGFLSLNQLYSIWEKTFKIIFVIPFSVDLIFFKM